MLKLGDILDSKYRILRLLGRGGSGYVYLAENINVGRRWAVKEININEAQKTNLLAEVDILRLLDHKGLPRIVDLVEQGTSLFIIEDFFEGRSLKEVINDRAICTEENITTWANQLCDILDYLHNISPNPIIYRDMKPANVIIDNQNNARLVDLGIAREYKDGQETDTVYIGTRGYAAPEQYMGTSQTDCRTDIYGLGMTLYHALTGLNPNSPPYQIVPVRKINSGLSRGIESIITKCTQNNPLLRYQTVKELINDLNNTQRVNCQVLEQSIPYNNRFLGSKVVVIGGLSHRSGSSFLTGNLAALMASFGVSTAVVESPINFPYYYDALFIRKKMNSSFLSCSHQIKCGNPVNPKDFFIEYGVKWVVSDPSLALIDNWTLADMTKLVYSTKQTSLIIVDVSTNWNHPSVRPLLSQADHVFIVIDPDPVLLDRTGGTIYDRLNTNEDNIPIETKTMTLFYELLDSDCKHIDFVINKYCNFIDINQLDFPLKPIVLFPHLDPASVYKSLWDGKLACSYPDFKSIFEAKLLPIINKLTNTYLPGKIRSEPEGVVRKVKAVINTILKEKGEAF